MDIKAITEIVNDKFTDDKTKAAQIIIVLAKNENVLSDVMEILKEERVLKRELLTDMNMELSRAHIFIDSFMPPIPKLKKEAEEKGFSKSFVLDKIAEFYIKHKGIIRHCFNRFS